MADKKINKNKIANRLRSAEQCFLVANIPNLVEVEEGKSSIKQSLCRYHISLSSGQHTKIKQIATAEELIGNLFVGSEMQTFFDISEEELSYLSPKIRLYRVDTEEKDKKKRVREFKFANFQNSKIIDVITKGASDRVMEAGIQSCEWRLLGKNPASVDKMIDVTIKFFFSSIETLLSNGTPNSAYAPRYLDLIDRFSKSADNKYKILMEVGYEIPDENINILDKKRAKNLIKAIQKSNKIYLLNIKNHELDFSQEGQIGLSVSYIGSIESDMRNIYLYDNTEQVTRQKDFIEKKKIEDKKKLEQRKLSVLTSLLKELKSKKNKPKEKIPLQSNALGNFVLGSAASYVENPEFRIWKRKVREVSAIINRQVITNIVDKIDVLARIDESLKVERLIETEDVKLARGALSRVPTANPSLRSRRAGLRGILQEALKEAKRTSILSVKVDLKELSHVIGLQDLSKNLTKEQKKQLIVKPTYRDYLFSNQKNLTIENISDTGLQKKLSLIKEKFKNNPTKLKENLRELKELANKDVDKKEITIVDFCYLGDIYDAFIDAVLANPKNADKITEIESFLNLSKVVFGNITLRVYKRDGSSFNTTICLSDLPVSYNFFNAWFIKNVVDKSNLRLPLWSLFVSFIGTLIPASAGMTCFKNQDDSFKNFGRTKVKVTNGTVLSDKEVLTGFDLADGYKEIAKAIPSSKKLKKFDFEDIRRTQAYNANNSNLISTGKKQIVNYFVISTVNQLLDRRTKDFVRDTKNGIFHFFLGRDNGIVQTINFSKTDQKFLEESLLTTTKNSANLDVFRRIYNAEIQTFGNSSFIPGQMIYIDADVISRTSNLATNLGLGGYYLITDVSNSFIPGSFNTTIKGIFTGFGTGFDDGAKISRSTGTNPTVLSSAYRLEGVAKELKALKIARGQVRDDLYDLIKRIRNIT
jgi:hypothetical protein